MKFDIKLTILFIFFLFGKVYVNADQIKQYPSAHLVLKNETEIISYFRDGSYKDKDEVFLAVLDEKGKKEAQIQSFYINKHYSQFDLELLELIKPDGRKHKIDIKKYSKIEAPSSDVEMNIYDPNVRVLKVFIPGLQPKDIIHYKISRKVFKPIIPGEIYGMIVVQQSFPVHSYYLKIQVPKDKRLFHLIKEKSGKVSFEQRLLANKREYIWHFKEIPKLVPEPYMIPFHRVAMRLLFSTIPSWEKVSKWYFSLVEPKLKPTDAIRKKVKELIKGKKDDLQKIKAIFYFVAQKIRYLGIIAESNRPGFEPHDVSLTFTRRYGVCRDKAALLVCMLRCAGFHAAPVLISMGKKLDKEIVVPYFNHAIAAVLDENDIPIYFLDPTSETSKQLLPDYDRNSSYLIAHKKGSLLGVIPAVLPDKNLIVIKIKDRLTKDGDIKGTIFMQCHGFADTVFRSILLNKSYEEQKRFIVRFLEGKRKGLYVKKIKFSDPMDKTTPFKCWARFKIEKAAVIINNNMLLWPVSSTKYIGLLDKWILSKASLTKRKYPLRFGYLFSDKWEEEIDLSALRNKILEIIPPVSLNKENELIHYSSQISLFVKGVKLKISKNFSLKKSEVSATEYSIITRLQHDMRYEYLFPIILKIEK